MAPVSKTLGQSRQERQSVRALQQHASGANAQNEGISLMELDSILNQLPKQFITDIRQLKKKLAYVPGRKSSQLFAFCSSMGGEGTSTLAHALALARASTNTDPEFMHREENSALKNGSDLESNTDCRGKTVLVDANLHTPSLHEFMNVQQDAGLVDLLEGKLNFPEALKWIVSGRLALITAGAHTENSTDLFFRKQFRAFLSNLRAEFQTIIFDCPPVNLYPDIITFLDEIDGVVLAIHAEKTNVSDVLRTRIALQRHGAHRVGVVLNRFQEKIPSRLNKTFY